MIVTDFDKVENLILAYPQHYENEYVQLVKFYDQLIELIPSEINLVLIVNSRKLKLDLLSKYSHRSINIIVNEYWDEIWLRDCLGINTQDYFYKPIYFPYYCENKKHWKYFKKINEISLDLINRTIDKPIKQIPLIWDIGNIVSNHQYAIITNKLLEDNPKFELATIENIIKDYLELNPIFINKQPNDVIGHTDGFLSFIDDKNILISDYPSFSFMKEDKLYLKDVQKVLYANNLNFIKMAERPVDKIVKCNCDKHKAGCFYTAKGNYINFLRLNNTIILPEYKLHNKIEHKFYNTINVKMIERMGFEIKTINCDQLSKFGVSLHCISYTF